MIHTAVKTAGDGEHNYGMVCMVCKYCLIAPACCFFCVATKMTFAATLAPNLKHFNTWMLFTMCFFLNN